MLSFVAAFESGYHKGLSSISERRAGSQYHAALTLGAYIRPAEWVAKMIFCATVRRCSVGVHMKAGSAAADGHGCKRGDRKRCQKMRTGDWLDAAYTVDRILD